MKTNTSQHFVPQFYLREWGDNDERLWQYSVNGGQPTHSRVKNVAFERGLYSHPAADNVPPLKTEVELSVIEGGYASVWPDIIDRADNARTRHNLARFIALTFLRNPNQRKTVQDINAMFRKVVAGLSPDEIVEVEADGKTSLIRVQEILDGADDHRDNIKGGHLRLMRERVEDISTLLMQRRWGVVFSDQPVFVTSDCPVVLDRGMCKRRAFGFGTPGVRTIFPFSPKRMLVIEDSWPHEFAHYKLTKADVFNEIIVKSATRFVYAHSNESDLPGKILRWRNED